MNAQAFAEKSFPERLAAAMREKGGPVVVGLDPFPHLFPGDVLEEGRRLHDDPRQAVSAAIVAFNRRIIDAVVDIAVAVKPQLAFYEQLGWHGMRALEATISYARQQGLLVIADGKRNDIGSTAAAYARAYLGGGGEGVGDVGGVADQLESGLEADALTINPYFGSDGVAPFLDACRERGKGLFVLVRTSNPSGAELQHLPVADEVGEARDTVAHRVADLIVKWNEGMPTYDGFGPVGAVVGATAPEQAVSLRRRMPGVMFLVPGYGAQGAGADEAKAAFDERGRGALVNSARGVLYAWRAEHPGEPGTIDDYAAAARRAALRMRHELAVALDSN